MAYQEDFIKAIAPYCVKYAKQYGFKVASPAIAQACLESGYGTSTKAKHHNYFGLKYRANRITVNNGTFVDGSSEQNKDGSYVAITDQWFNFDTIEKGVEGYFQFINIANYAKVKQATTPLGYLQQLHKAGYATSLKYVDNIYSVITKWNLTKYDSEAPIQSASEAEIPQGGKSMGNSPLVGYVSMSPNHSGKRNHTVDTITPHCYVGQVKAQNAGAAFSNPKRKASANYTIATDGTVVLHVDEENRSWCSSSAANDNRAITIENACDATAPYAFNDKVYNKLVDLCVDICQRYGKNTLVWIPDKAKGVAYEPKANEMKLTAHRWLAATACPGEWMYARMGDLANRVNAKLGSAGSTPVVTSPTPTVQTSKPQVSTPTAAFKVRVTDPSLNVRKGPGTNYPIAGTIKDMGVYTIVETQGSWGKLKSGAGWISLNYTKKE